MVDYAKGAVLPGGPGRTPRVSLAAQRDMARQPLQRHGK